MSAPTESEVLIRDFLCAHPALDSELGEIEVMTDRYTNEEWAKQIAETQRQVLKEVEERSKEGGRGWKYAVPRTASAEFAKTVDHTVLKLDVKEAGIDGLCSEARTEGFKVSLFPSLYRLGIDKAWNRLQSLWVRVRANIRSE